MLSVEFIVLEIFIPSKTPCIVLKHLLSKREKNDQPLISNVNADL